LSVTLTYRPATPVDAELASDLMTFAYPELPEDPVMTRYEWEHPDAGWAYGRFIAELEGRPIAYVKWSHGPWDKVPDRHSEVEVYLDRAVLDFDLLKSLWSWAGEQATEAGSWLLVAYAVENEHEALDVLSELGFKVDRTEKVWELDLKEHGPRLIEEAKDARVKMTREGIQLVSLAQWRDRDALRKLHGLNEMTANDMPHSVAIVPATFEDYALRMESPERPQDRYWIALDGDQPVALSYLRFPPVRGHVWTGYTCTHPRYRGRGIARAVKLQGLAQAAELGVPSVFTDNDSENTPMLHINERLGYHRKPGFVDLQKGVRGS
jgi:RimJ/RimL family protein N-acetyltransferase